ncbi:ArsR/SmtB family transcription factor [Aquimarina sp. LLG6339-5]|uniref:ArsR/SmtB family transcription factor n=1 Tax=Aquimarina sp. LLG6339-5 TaxID=3160830 RepID=UPI0038640C5E
MRRDVFQAIADPVRRDIISLLAEQALSINAIAEKFDISRPAISKHIKILEECGIISINKKGRERYCLIQPKNLVPAFLWIDQYKNLWEEKLDSFEEYLNKLQSKA